MYPEQSCGAISPNAFHIIVGWNLALNVKPHHFVASSV